MGTNDAGDAFTDVADDALTPMFDDDALGTIDDGVDVDDDDNEVCSPVDTWTAANVD